MAFTRNPSDTGVSPATYSADGASDLVLVDQQRDIAIDGSDKKDSIVVSAAALASNALYNYDVRGFEGDDVFSFDAALIQDSTINGNVGNDVMTLGTSAIGPITNFNGSYFLGGKGDDSVVGFDVNGGEINGNIGTGKTLGAVSKAAFAVLSDYELPPGYTLYDGGASDTLNRSESVIQTLLALAVFLVFVVMAVQYESLRNPLIILAGVPFAAIGVALAIMMLQLPLSMPLWLGLIMLAGIVVNNAIVLVEYIELERGRGQPFEAAILSAGRLRLRPILMTTLTTVVGMLPLALGWGEGAEMLQPLAIAIVWGLSFSTLVSLLLIPVLYRMMAVGDVTMMAAPAAV